MAVRRRRSPVHSDPRRRRLRRRASAAALAAVGAVLLALAPTGPVGRIHYVLLGSSGAVSVWLDRGGDGSGGRLGRGHVASGLTADATRVSTADFTGDGNADYVLGDNTTKAATVYAWQGGDGHGSWNDLGRAAGGGTNG